jgi:hypothetical protein
MIFLKFRQLIMKNNERFFEKKRRKAEAGVAQSV